MLRFFGASCFSKGVLAGAGLGGRDEGANGIVNVG